jgi:cell division septation protein DedD
VYVTLIFVKRNSSPAPVTRTTTHNTTKTTSYAHYTPVAAVTAAKPKPRPVAKPAAPVAQPRTVSLLVQLVGLDADAVNPATGSALGV